MFHRLFTTSVMSLSFAATLTLSTPAFADSHAMAGKLDIDMVMAKVGDVEITLGHMVAMGLTLPDQKAQMSPEDFFNGVLQRLVQQESVAQSVDSISRLNELQLENERRSLWASVVVEDIATSVEVTPEQLKAAYDSRFAEYAPETEYNASHILVETEDEAKAIVAELAAGADFEKVAMEKSTGPSGPNGGQLGWFGPGRMVAEFEAAVKELDVKEVSGPVKTQFGWHVIILNESRLPSVPTFDEMKAELDEEMRKEMFNTTLMGIIEAAPVERTDISTLDPAVLALDPASVEK